MNTKKTRLERTLGWLSLSLAVVLSLTFFTYEFSNSPSNFVSKANYPIKQAQKSKSPRSTRTQALAIGFGQRPLESLTPGPLYSAQIKAENQLPGTSAWRITGQQKTGMIEGFAKSSFSYDGDNLPLYISTLATSYRISAFRMGWYQGLLGRLIWTSGQISGIDQPNCLMLSPTNTTECSNWEPSYDLRLTTEFLPGDYLLKLTTDTGAQQYIPLTVADPNSNAAIAVINAVTDWQAYNDFGGYSLYHGPAYDYANRATKVSFDRPYDFNFGFGSGDFLGNELPLVALVEHLGLNVTYVNSILLEQHPELVGNHNVMVSLGHDEYYSPVMRAALRAGVNQGRSLMFLGANAIFRRIRFDSTALGPDRIEVNYRNPYQDPLLGVDNKNVTANWPSYPDPSPESSLIGIQYQCNPVNASMVITDPNSWILADTNLSFGSVLPHLIGSEFDQFLPYFPHPANLEILAHSPLLCRNVPYYSDMTYYSTPAGGGVFATGTNYWVVTLQAGCPAFAGLCPDRATDQVTTNVLDAFGSGGAGTLYPSDPNALGVYNDPPFRTRKPVVVRITTSVVASTTTSRVIAAPPTSTTTTAPVTSVTSPNGTSTTVGSKSVATVSDTPTSSP